MTDTTNGGTNGSADSKKKAISKREWIDAAGVKIATGGATVAGFRYTNLESGESAQFMFADNPVLTAQFAAMGGLTKIGNVVNSVVNADDYDGSNPMVAANEWLAAANGGEWREPGDGVARGPKYDNGVLADVIAAMPGAKGDSAHYVAKLDDKKYRAAVLRVEEVMAAYAAEATKRGLVTKAPAAKSVGDIL
jgi:hypothetical protein